MSCVQTTRLLGFLWTPYLKRSLFPYSGFRHEAGEFYMYKETMQIKVTFILITYKMIYYDQSQSFCFSSVCNLVKYVFVRTDN